LALKPMKIEELYNGIDISMTGLLPMFQNALKS